MNRRCFTIIFFYLKNVDIAGHFFLNIDSENLLTVNLKFHNFILPTKILFNIIIEIQPRIIERNTFPK